MFLRVRRRECPKRAAGEAAASEGHMPPRVRVRWDDSFGPPPFFPDIDHSTNLPNGAPGFTTAIFQRLSKNITALPGGVHPKEALSPSILVQNKFNEFGTTLCVSAVKRVENRILIDCEENASESPFDTVDRTSEDVYVMVAGPNDVQRDRSPSTSSSQSDEFDLSKLTISQKPLPRSHVVRQISKRTRHSSAGGGSNSVDTTPTFFLIPPRRARWEEAKSDMERPSMWPPICEEHGDTLLSDCLHGYEELAAFVLERGGAAEKDLYCFPDHRKDDEYDSNAEDFSGNDYPESEGVEKSISDIDTDSGTKESDAFGDDQRHSKRVGKYGFFFGFDSLEASLGEGWESDFS